jgi:ubiquinone/menaquinone biosynthesis C-methylase UbiE
MSPQTIRQYGNAAWAYQQTFVPAIAEPVAPPLLEQAALVPGERVLDVACGTGVVTRQAADAVRPTGRVAGLDLSAEMIEVAASLPARPGCVPGWRQGDAGTLPYRDETFDVVLCQMGLMFFPDRAAALREMRRVLVPGGRVVVGTPGTIPAPFSVLDAGLVRHIGPDLGGFCQDRLLSR